MTTDSNRAPDPYEGLDPLARQVAEREDEEIGRKPDPPPDRVIKHSVPALREKQRREALTGRTEVHLGSGAGDE